MENPLVAGSRSLAVIEIVGRNPAGMAFTALATTLQLSSATLTRILKMLVIEEWIRQDRHTGHYVPGHRLLKLGEAMRRQSLIGDVVAPIVNELSASTGHSACFAASQGYHFILVAKQEQRRSYHFLELLTPNLDWIDNGMGQFLLAFQPPDFVDEIYRHYFHQPVPDEHQARFETIREHGVYTSDEGHVTRVICGVSLEAGRPVENLLALAALSSETLDLPALQLAVKAAAASIENDYAIARTSPGARR
jgi:DNA-binding IclR family transcriptional regulator